MRMFPRIVREIEDEAKLAVAAERLDPNAFDEEAYDPYAPDAMGMAVRRVLANAEAARIARREPPLTRCPRWWDSSGDRV